MEQLVLSHEAWLRGGAFVAVFAIMAIWEWRQPARARRSTRRERWTRNLAITILGAVTTRLMIPLLAVGVAVWAEATGFGLMNAETFGAAGWPFWVKVTVAIIILDLVIYTQHLVFHHVPWLWRLHRMHHADEELDVTTGGRFHPLEIWLSMGIKMAVVAALGAPVVAVILFEVILSALALFNHANVAIPPAIDRVLRAVIVTPAMHRVHHSPEKQETNSNFGFNLSIWDRLFRTYRRAVKDPDAEFTIGLWSHRDPARRRFGALIVDPFKDDEATRSAERTTS